MSPSHNLLREEWKMKMKKKIIMWSLHNHIDWHNTHWQKITPYKKKVRTSLGDNNLTFDDIYNAII